MSECSFMGFSNVYKNNKLEYMSGEYTLHSLRIYDSNVSESELNKLAKQGIYKSTNNFLQTKASSADTTRLLLLISCSMECL